MRGTSVNFRGNKKGAPFLMAAPLPDCFLNTATYSMYPVLKTVVNAFVQVHCICCANAEKGRFTGFLSVLQNCIRRRKGQMPVF
jgi:hypothetical protein